jgi:dolichol-phosphate mannosyltransferase
MMTSQLVGNLEFNSQVGVILPTYCEAQNIEKLIGEVECLPLKISIIVVDDSSPDGTADIVKRLQTKYAGLLLLVRPQKSGLGTAITDGFRAFLSLKYVPEYVVTMDADYSHNPADLPRLVSCMGDRCALALGSRYCSGGKTTGWPYTRKIVSRGANALARSVLGLKLHDCTRGYRCYSTELLKEILPYLHSQTYDIQIETIKQAHLKCFDINEIPIAFVNRKRGKSKLSYIEIENYLSYIFKTVLFR